MAYIREYSDLHPKERRQLLYKRRYKAEAPSWDDSMVLLTKLVKDRLMLSVDVLDIGCGHGNFVIDELGEVFTSKTGYDVSPESCSGNTSVDRVVIGNGKNLPFDVSSFDVVVSLWAFEHVPDPLAVFREVFRVLRPNGVFAFVTPNKHSFLILLRRLMNKKMANRLLERLYGRTDDDIFDVYYRANTIADIQAFANAVGFVVESLVENADPSYTSFGSISYVVSKWFSWLPLSASKPHLVAVLRKP